jgi:hypothetical protein
MKFIPSKLLLAFLALIPLSAGAETVFLKDGTSISGKIKNVGTEAVVIETSIGEMTVESAKVLRLERTTDAQPAPRKTYADWHTQQKNGLGFGLGLTSMPGIIMFYDHNLSTTSQWHTQLDVNAMSRSNVLGEQIIKTQRSMILSTYRHFFSENSGFYVGAGGGYADSKFEYKGTPLFSSSTYQYDSKASGVFLLGEIGWQGIEGYYFHVGLQPAAYITSSDNFDINSIPNISNHRSVANQEHDAQKQLSQVSVGFGWFF